MTSLTNKKFLICAPANFYSGGPTLSHQLCDKLIQRGYQASIFYYNYNGNENASPVHPYYKELKLPYTLHVVDEDDCVIITNETFTDIFNNIKRSKKIIWWMSVDFFWDAWKCNIPGVKNKIRHFLLKIKCHKEFSRHFDVKRKDVLHFSQCNYVYDFLIKYGIKKKRIYPLSDFIENIDVPLTSSPKEDIVLYNPKKGLAFTELLMQQAPEIKWVPIINKTPLEVRKLLLKSKVYIDFGHHPGKDRLPREAALFNCCVITGLKGSARYSTDLPIPEKFKIEGSEKNIPTIISLIKELLSAYEENIKNFEAYKNIILKEEEKFDSDLSTILHDFRSI